MSNAWPMVRLGDVLRHYREYIDAPESRTYLKLSVRLYGRGVTLDAPVDGATLKMKRHQLARPGQVILSEIWGKKGAMGFVPPEGEGALCTSHFFLFDIDEERLLRGWLAAIFRANYLAEQLDARAFGTTGYAAVRPKDLLAATIPLPPLSEQRRIVATIEQLSSKIEEAKALHDAVGQRSDHLCRAIVADQGGGPIRLTPMSDLVDLRKPDVEVAADGTYHFAGVYCFGRGVFAGERRTGLDFAYKQLTRLRSGEFVYPKLMAWEGALAVVPDECVGLFVSPEFPVFSIRRDRVLPEVLDVYFRTPSVWPMLSGASTGTNVRRRRLNPKDFLAYQFPLPPMATQLRLRQVKGKVDQLKTLQAQTAAELDALLPSILDRAFRGEL